LELLEANLMATPTDTQRAAIHIGDPSIDSTQRGCTSWLLISCLVLTITTSFVFGWGLGAPNMYNHYTEPFLKRQDPCVVEAQAKAKSLEETTTIAAAATTTTVVPPIVNNEDAGEEGDDSIVEPKLDEDGNDIEEPEEQQLPVQSGQSKEDFNFVAELVKGIPQTVFLIGAFIGALTGPFWSKLFDRKRTVFANYIFCFASSLCVLLAYYFTRPWLFYLSRLLLGYQGKKKY
jgi:hypothetical protein